MSSVAIIGDIDTVSGFRLGGVKKAEVVNTSEEAIAAFDKFDATIALDRIRASSLLFALTTFASNNLVAPSPSPAIFLAR